MPKNMPKRSKSLSYAEDSEHPLCLCEYHNKNNERVHMLMCCCNCEAVDALCTSVICGCCDSSNNSPRFQRYSLLYESFIDFLDRLRYPYIGGARKFNWDFVLSILCILAYDYIGSYNFVLSMFAFFVSPLVLYLRFFLARVRSTKKQSRAITLKVLATNPHLTTDDQERIQIAHFIIINALIYLLYRCNSSLFDEVSASDTEKNVINIFIVLLSCTHLYLHNSDPGHLERETSSQMGTQTGDQSYCTKCNFNRNDRVGHCTVCRTCIANRDHHCFWIDNCVGYFNHKVFVFYLLCLLGLAVFSFVLLFVHFHKIDCAVFGSEEHVFDQPGCLSDAFYSNRNKGFLFLFLIQLGSIVFYLGLLVMQQLVFISLGMTQHELFRLSQKNYRFTLAGFVKSSMSFKKFCKNWISFLQFRSKENLVRVSRGSANEHQI